MAWPGNVVLAALVISLALHHGGAQPQPGGPTTGRPAASPEHKSQQQWYMDSLPKNVTEFLDNCTDHMSVDCATEVISAMLLRRDVSDVCCGDLVLMGIECHSSLVKLFIHSPDQKANAPLIIANSQRVFDYCTVVDRKRRYPTEVGF
ncbi:unnamed protein product [Cuscuta campestris]|uniref:Prolamin-like domain-containing protein n=1 Tax=Cuscuta campestris TaxID=132261 RepID=A0A484N9F0_9ASTE|nr:unnamed protein product [Cuscuta campestris]